MIRKIIIIGICIFLVVLFLSHFLVVFKRNVFLSDIKGLVEEKVGSLFDARVKIGAVKVGLFKYVSLSGLRVNQQLKKKFFYLVDIKTIVFKYNIFNFFKINFAAPNKVSLYTPTLEFNRFKIPDNLLNQAFSWGKSNVLLEIRDGAVCYVLPNIKTKFLFEHINGYVKPYDLHTLALKFKARGGGDIAGAIGLNGFFNEKTKICELDISLDNITIASPTFAPINNLRGKVRISNEIITIEEITFFIRDVPIRLTGTITQYSEKPILDLHFSIDTKHITSTVRIFGIYSDLKIEGEIRLARYHYTYRGAIDLKEGGFAVRELTINDDYVSEGDFSFNEGIYTIFFKKANQEVQCQFLHTDYVMKLNITLNHVSLLDYDFVTVGYIELEPDVSFWRDQALVFNGTIETEYMIFNYTPLNDFKGTFTLYADAVRNIHCSWGKAYALTGNINFNEPREMDGLFTITDLNLQDCESFGGYVIPNDIEATIS
ncbi:MAG: hypothetical protein KKH94_03245 [Candidatus Omnitrophica bacterium]|nr:hypothetical protein [Candidatus Omnitrophota bacterium]